MTRGGGFSVANVRDRGLQIPRRCAPRDDKGKGIGMTRGGGFSVANVRDRGLQIPRRCAPRDDKGKGIGMTTSVGRRDDKGPGMEHKGEWGTADPSSLRSSG